MRNLSISNTVTISGPNRSAKVTDHFTCFSVNVICCIISTLCKNLHRRNRKKIGGPLSRTPTRRRKKKRHTDASKPNQLGASSIYLITPTRTWLFAGYVYTTETQKAAKISSKNSSLNGVHSLHTELKNASHSTIIYSQISISGKAPLHFHTANLLHPTIPLFALAKG